MGRLLVHLRQMAASTCDRLQLFKDIYFSPNWWHHRVLQLCIIGKEAPLMYWSPCCVTRGFKKITVTLSQPEKTMESVGPTVTLTSCLCVGLQKSMRTAGWLDDSGCISAYVCEGIWVCVCVSFFVCDPKRSEFKLWFTESHVVPLPTGRRALSICCLHSHKHMQIHTLGKKKQSRDRYSHTFQQVHTWAPASMQTHAWKTAGLTLYNECSDHPV